MGKSNPSARGVRRGWGGLGEQGFDGRGRIYQQPGPVWCVCLFFTFQQKLGCQRFWVYNYKHIWRSDQTRLTASTVDLRLKARHSDSELGSVKDPARRWGRREGRVALKVPAAARSCVGRCLLPVTGDPAHMGLNGAGALAHVVEFHIAAPFWAVYPDETVPLCL